jgi:hypothetical protein
MRSGQMTRVGSIVEDPAWQTSIGRMKAGGFDPSLRVQVPLETSVMPHNSNVAVDGLAGWQGKINLATVCSWGRAFAGTESNQL